MDADALQPVFLEPRDDYWKLHRPQNVSTDRQRTYQFAPLATAEQLENAIYCEDCFPRKHDAARE